MVASRNWTVTKQPLVNRSKPRAGLMASTVALVRASRVEHEPQRATMDRRRLIGQGLANIMVTIYTIGHSTRSADDFREVLDKAGIELLVDVRQFPGSRRFPHFNAASLKNALSEGGIAYVHEVDLGGRRRPQANSPNSYWKNASFRAFADHMSTPAFLAALERLIASASQRTAAIMCAEAVPWSCHRWLISDALVARGIEVVHLINATTNKPHVLNPQAHVSPQGYLTYPAATGDDAGPLLFD
jgi:hypothetical protein